MSQVPASSEDVPPTTGETEVKPPQLSSVWTKVPRGHNTNGSQTASSDDVPETNSRQDLLTITALHTAQQRIPQKPAGIHAQRLIR
ncbi:Hypothetical predicted protein [Xyrichtys novacula]|uniref:Uncharacterized protein n=1 Tax=Xyrichtys novacula TaxID=13765 RepID=A0AAV1HN67_XYRNO|nr:Hypothetical predicted protein [Xyrichtys novacula]